MIDKAAIFSAILRKNALRREAGLPEWPVRKTYEKEVRGAAWREHVEEHGARVHAEVLSRQRAKFGADYPQSAGGRMAVYHMVGKVLRKRFAQLPINRDRCDLRRVDVSILPAHASKIDRSAEGPLLEHDFQDAIAHLYT